MMQGFADLRISGKFTQSLRSPLSIFRSLRVFFIAQCHYLLPLRGNDIITAHNNYRPAKVASRTGKREKEKRSLLAVCAERGDVTATTTRRVRDFVYRGRSWISSRRGGRRREISPGFLRDNVPGGKDNAPGDTGREGHDYPLPLLATGCRGVTPDGIYEAARKATDEI